MQTRTALIVHSLECVVAQVGDPNDRVYARLFSKHPEFEDLFCMDVDGAVRANMLITSIDCLLGVAEGRETPRLLLEAARVHHDGYGVEAKDINVMFEVIRDEFCDIVGPKWTTDMEAAWASLLDELSDIEKSIAN